MNFIKSLFLTAFLFGGQSSFAMTQHYDVDDKQTLSQKIDMLNTESSSLLQKIKGKKGYIKICCNLANFCIVVLPYTTSYVIDGYFAEHKWVKDWLYYSITPVTQATGIMMISHNFSLADINLASAEITLKNSFEFFSDLKLVCKNLHDILLQSEKDKIYEMAEFQLRYFRDQETPVGKFLVRIFQGLQKSKTIPFEFEKPRQIYCQIFASLLSAVIDIKMMQIIENKVILNFNGISLSSYDFLNLKTLKREVMTNFKSAGYEKNHKINFPFLDKEKNRS